MLKPGWISSLPPFLVPSSGPKLKSDQWRTLASLYLPVTLIRLWASPPSGSRSKLMARRQRLLNLTMSLTSAIIIATSRETSPHHAEAYLQHMLEYRMELRSLFPEYKCHSIHHMALHLDEFLCMYGPVHGWWTYPFERVIGMLQRIPVNYKNGEWSLGWICINADLSGA